MRHVVAFGVLATVFGSSARAGITFYDLFYSAFYTQSSDVAPTTPDIYVVASRVLTDNAGDLAQAKLAVPGAPFLYNLFAVEPTTYLVARNFASASAMEAGFPAGVYTHTISGGTLGTVAGTLTRPTDLFFTPSVPAFDAASFAVLSAWPSTQDVTVSFSAFAKPAAANTALTFLTIFDSGNNVVFNTIEPGETTTSITVPANTLQAGATYRATLYYSSRIELANAGFGAATSIVGCDRATNATITTRAACPGDINNDGFVDDSDFVIFAAAYNILDCADPQMPSGCPADLNADLVVDDGDFVIFAAAYNELLCP
ncbi:MAG: hypothetical protein K2Y21_06810 [Phycisphaerales bacterium]|nr:hypothetical protein [Phycisphaerales bacterium]